jgi:hypothetical protein
MLLPSRCGSAAKALARELDAPIVPTVGSTAGNALSGDKLSGDFVPGPPASGPPPALPRRVRSAREGQSQPGGGVRPGISLASPASLDADAARAAIEEFEAGVDQALRDSAHDLPIRRRPAAPDARGAGDTDEEKGPRP